MLQVPTRIQEFETLQENLGGHGVRVVTYLLGGRYVCIIESIDPGAAICRVSAQSKLEAIRVGLAQAEQNIVPMPDSLPRADVVCETHIDRIVMEISGAQVSFTIQEFLALSLQDRMKHIFSGKLLFLDGHGLAIPVGEAIELLRSTPSASLI